MTHTNTGYVGLHVLSRIHWLNFRQDTLNNCRKASWTGIPRKLNIALFATWPWLLRSSIIESKIASRSSGQRVAGFSNTGFCFSFQKQKKKEQMKVIRSCNFALWKQVLAWVSIQTLTVTVDKGFQSFLHSNLNQTFLHFEDRKHPSPH